MHRPSHINLVALCSAYAVPAECNGAFVCLNADAELFVGYACFDVKGSECVVGDIVGLIILYPLCACYAAAYCAGVGESSCVYPA